MRRMQESGKSRVGSKCQPGVGADSTLSRGGRERGHLGIIESKSRGPFDI